MSSQGKVKVSVILSSYNNGPTLWGSVNSLLQQDYRCLELIVVDAGSTDYSVHLLRDMREQGLISAYLHSDSKAPLDINAVREIGCKLSNGSLICFADSDCVYPQNWASVIVASFEEHDVAAVFGSRWPDEGVGLGAYVRRLEGFNSRKFRCTRSVLFTSQSRALFYFAGCNLAVSRQVLATLHLLDPCFRKVTFEDVDLQKRMLDAGYNVLFEPRLRVRHIHSLSAVQFLRKASKSGAGFANLVCRHHDMILAKWSPITDLLVGICFLILLIMTAPLPFTTQALAMGITVFAEGLRRLRSRALLRENPALLIMAVPLKLMYDALRFLSFLLACIRLITDAINAIVTGREPNLPNIVVTEVRSPSRQGS